MKPNLSPSLFLSSFLGLISVSVQADHTDMKCEVSSCGNITNISYPFWLSGEQPSYCGFPAFKLRCINNGSIPLIEMPSGDYQVKNIFYENNSLVVANDKLVRSECPLFYSNVTFAVTPFAVSPSTNRELYLFYNCSQFRADYFQVGCASIGINVFAFLGGDYGSFEQQQDTCSGADYVIPVLGYLSSDSSQYKTLIKKGFLLEWTVAECKQCTRSKGRCGYSSQNNNFICICSDRLHAKSCEKKNVKKTIAIACAVGGVVVLIAACCVFFFWYKRRKRLQQSALSNLPTQSTSSSKFSSMNDPELADSNYQTHIFTYEELQEATNGFDASRELGDGGFGTVYKGKLRDGRTVAVKRLYENNYKRLEQFMNEVDILSRLRHPNLVTLYGCTSRRSRELLLVYEFVARGTVAEHLHGTHASSGPLLWQDRMSIAIEIADALSYLHAIEPPIIHRDVKSNNILLDSNFHVKVADFGLSRLFPLDATHVSTAPQGTPGYVDPEYHQCYQLTDKSDVYSFGVVLVELISSKPAVDISRSRHEINLANMAVNKIQKSQLEQLVDPALGYHSDLGVKRMIAQVAELAFRCLQSDGDLRPSIKEVLEELRRIHSQVQTKEEVDAASLFSPDSVAERWHSRSTTPNSSE